MSGPQVSAANLGLPQRQPLPASASGDPTIAEAAGQASWDPGPGIDGIVAAATSATVAYRYLLAYAFIIVVMVLITRFKWGYAVVYYSLLLMIVFVLVTQTEWIKWVLAPFQWTSNRS